MAGLRQFAAACAASFFSVGSPTIAQSLPTPIAVAPSVAPAAAVWRLRAGLNVAALACRGDGEAAIVAGYNRLLTDHSAELATDYAAMVQDYAGQAGYDSAMTRLYNAFAQPAAQAALCGHAAQVLAVLAGSAPVAPQADAALAELTGATPEPALPAVQVAVVTIAQILPQSSPAPGVPADPGL